LTTQDQVEWRRSTILKEFLCKGYTNQAEIAREMHLSPSIICRDIQILEQEAVDSVSTFIRRKIPLEWKITMQTIENLKNLCFKLLEQTDDIDYKLTIKTHSWKLRKNVGR
jgi:predicted transcriptional regulator